ncbi:MAG: hypothetical protein ACT4P9_14770 [Betaproteobacteria bacterium]
MGQRLFWKGFFFLMAGLTIGSYVLPFLYPTEMGENETQDFALLPLYIAQLIGLFGFAYWRAIGTRRIWQWIFGATVLETAWMTYGFLSESLSESSPSEPGSFFMIGLAATIFPLLVLFFWALFSYAFRAPHPWAKAT